MRVLITGSSGQIGTNVGLALQQRGDSVVGIDNRPNAWTKDIETITLDLREAALPQFPNGSEIDLVLHFAANAKVFELVLHPERAMDNISMLFNTLEYARANKLPIIFASSREVYGDIQRLITDETAADFVVAESPYSASKIAGEALIYSYAQCYELPFLIFRFSNVYGRFDNDLERMERVIPLFMDRIAREQPITVFGREKVLDFTYVDDAVTGVLAGVDALASGLISGETINLAYGQGNSLVDLVNILALALQKEPRVTYEPSQTGEVTRYVADLGKARSLLGYNPQTPLSSGLIKACAWSRSVGALP
jgi:nucleoside-diphosphate-sugar epimerase